MKKTIAIILLLIIITGCSKKNEQPVILDGVKEKIKDINSSEIVSTDKNIMLGENQLINLNYDSYGLKAKDDDLELINYYRNNYLFAIYDANSERRILPTIQTIFKTKDKEHVIKNISITHAVIKDETSFYYFSFDEEKYNIHLNFYDVIYQKNQLLESFPIQSILNLPYFFRDNLGNIYFNYINDQEQTFDIYQEKDNHFNKLVSIRSTEKDLLYYGPELVRISDDTLYYVRGYEDHTKIFSVDLNTKEEKVLYELNQGDLSFYSLIVKDNNIIFSIEYNDYSNGENFPKTVSVLYIINGNEVLKIYDIGICNNLHFLDDDKLLFSNYNDGKLRTNVYDLTNKTRSVIKINNDYLKEQFLIFDNKLNIGFYREQRFYQLDLESFH